METQSLFCVLLSEAILIVSPEVEEIYQIEN